MTTPTAESPLMTLQEVAAACGLHMRTIEREVADGRLVSFLVRGARRVSRDDFMAYLQGQRDAAVELQRQQIQTVRTPREATQGRKRAPRPASRAKPKKTRPQPVGLLGGKGLADLLT